MKKNNFKKGWARCSDLKALLSEGFDISDCKKARKAAVKDIKEELRKEGKVFIEFFVEY